MDKTCLVDAVRRKCELRPIMNERMRRHWAASEALSLPRGGVTVVAQATGLSRTTIAAGVRELRAPVGTPPEDVRPERARATSLPAPANGTRLSSGCSATSRRTGVADRCEAVPPSSI